MMDLRPLYAKVGQDYPLRAKFLDSGLSPLTGLSPTVLIRRSSDGKYLNSAAGWETPPGTLPTMTELDAVSQPGRYGYAFSVPAGADDVEYDVLVDGGPTASNRYWSALIVSAPADWEDVEDIEEALAQPAAAAAAGGIEGEIATVALAPAEFESDGQRYRAHRIKDLIAADKYLEGKAAQAAGTNLAGITFKKLVPPGAP
ncbi:MAG: hypothetical protein GY778_13600 [bacterium]|nr:hypothetical protein [bacterium]